MLNHTTIGSNSRYIDVKMNGDAGPGKGGFGKGLNAPTPAAMKRINYSPDNQDPSRTVLVRGFDFDTTDEQLQAHMAQAGTMTEVQRSMKGSALVTFQDPQDAQYAIDTLNRSTIEGNSRYIDVLFDRGASGGGGGHAPPPPAKRAR